MSEYAIEARHVCHHYGKKQAVKDASFKVKWGSIYGLLGRNGAGKTTIMRMLAGLQRTHGGEVSVMGRNPRTTTCDFWEEVAYVGDTSIHPAVFSVEGLVKLCKGFYKQWDDTLVEDLLDKFQIPKESRANQLSQGEQRGLSFVLAMGPRPKVLMLDEPGTNLDVVVRRQLLEVLLEYIREDRQRAVLFTSHILTDVERVVDHIGIMSDKQVVIEGSLDELKEIEDKSLEDLFIHWAEKK